MGTRETSSSTELKSATLQEGLSEKECIESDYWGTNNFPLTEEGCQSNLLHGQGNEVHPSEQISSFTELVCFLRDLPPRDESQARALVSGEVKAHPPCMNPDTVRVPT